MVRASKSTEKSTTTSASAPVVAASAAAPAADKPKVKKTKVAAAPTEPVNELAPAPVSDAAPLDAAAALAVKLTEFNAKLQQLGGLFATVKNDFKTLEKTVSREMKNAQKASSKKRRSNVNRKPSGFVKPTRISDELAQFLGKTIGTEMARTDVSKEINTYIQANSLQDKVNGRIIHPDDKLTKLLKVSKDDQLTYFNLQKYMKHHFMKATPAVVA
uniref:DM2 domain-containing protein n=1 Tax=viral metagenome TaxID=1070528 RepID=A0A6C0DC82_9ZZZZ